VWTRCIALGTPILGTVGRSHRTRKFRRLRKSSIEVILTGLGHNSVQDGCGRGLVDFLISCANILSANPGRAAATTAPAPSALPRNDRRLDLMLEPPGSWSTTRLLSFRPYPYGRRYCSEKPEVIPEGQGHRGFDCLCSCIALTSSKRATW